MSSDTKTLSFEEIKAILPHRYPSLMVDRVMLIKAENRAIGIKNVSINEAFFLGHFPNAPVMPGILILEAMVQTGGIAIHEFMGTNAKFAFLKSISKAKFRRPVFPSDQLVINTHLTRHRNGIARLSAEAKVSDQLACQAEFTLGITQNITDITKPKELATHPLINGAPAEAKPLIDIHGVLNVLPHRYPFILVDSILKLKEPRIFGLKNVTGNEPFFQGHFPEHAIMPGTLLIEAMAQVGGVYILDRPQNKGKLGYLMAIDYARFKAPVTPGDQLVVEVQTLSPRIRGGKAIGRIHVGKTIVAEALITFIIVDRPNPLKTPSA